MKLYIAVGIVLALLLITEGKSQANNDDANRVLNIAIDYLKKCSAETHVDKKTALNFFDEIIAYGYTKTKSNTPCMLQCIHVKAGMMQGNAPFNVNATRTMLSVYKKDFAEHMYGIMHSCSNVKYTWEPTCEWTYNYELCAKKLDPKYPGYIRAYVNYL